MNESSDVISKDAQELIEMQALLHGLVQGVGFRATTRHCARQLGLSGSVRNLPQGGVEIIARGPRGKVEQLLPLLQQHSMGHIDSVTSRYFPCESNESGFHIL